ncbi:hypothetical protein [Lacticaseibacillus jixiensis]|uniref:hypothetical protein n=1 Tax=Lacticaseibacillus jixiensis TaxID=3231926 RepID=UPI0036F32F8A
MAYQVFVEGEVIDRYRMALVNHAGRSRISRPWAIAPTRVDVVGRSHAKDLRKIPLVLVPEWLAPTWQPGQHWRVVGTAVRQTPVLAVRDAALVAEESHDLRKQTAEFALDWVRRHQEGHAIKQLAHATDSFIYGRSKAATWYRRLILVTGDQAPLVVPGAPLSEALIRLARIQQARAMPAVMLTVLEDAWQLTGASLLAETIAPSQLRL